MGPILFFWREVSRASQRSVRNLLPTHRTAPHIVELYKYSMSRRVQHTLPFMAQVSLRYQVEPTHLTVVFKAARLDNTRRLADYGIVDGAVVHLVRQRRGWIYLAMHNSVIEVAATRQLGSMLNSRFCQGADRRRHWQACSSRAQVT